MEMMKLNLISLIKDNDWLKESFDYDKDDSNKSLPFINYILEDKSNYPLAKDSICYVTGKPFVDLDDDFLIGNSGGLLPKIDFVFINTHLFSSAAENYRKYGKYCIYPKDSIEYKQFWALETKRRRIGMVENCKLYFKDIIEYFNPKTTERRKKELLQPLRITGDFYNYLNYGRIERTPSNEELEDLRRRGLTKSKTIEDFPRFWDGDYWAYKIDELKINNDSNNIVAKARRKGFSYKRSNTTANTTNLNKNITTIFVADNIDYLTDKGALTYMTKVNLDWFENKTYWRRGYVSENLEEIELGYKKKHEGNKKYGYLSGILSYSIARDVNVAIGKKAIEIDVEEAGACPNLQRFIDVTLSNMESGMIQIGTFNIWGTGGTKGANWEDFERIYYKPSRIKGLQFENIWDDDKRHETCGYFHPNVLNLEPYIIDGNSLLFDSFIEDKKDKAFAKKNKSNDEYIIYCAQRANKPSEAFINMTENIFASPELNIHVNELKINSKYHFYTDGWYVKNKDGIIEFWNKDRCISEKVFNGKFHEFIIDVPHRNTTDIHGCIREYYNPKYINGEIPKDLYFITVDPYGIDKKKGEVSSKNSLYSFQVWTRDNGLFPGHEKLLVAEYTGRLNAMKENDLLLLYACMRWRAKVLVERNRGETITNFKRWKMQSFLLTDPSIYIDADTSLNDKHNEFGIDIGGSSKKLNGLTFLKDYLYEILFLDEEDISNSKLRLHTINSLPLCLELQKYSEDKNFDRISTAMLAMFEFKRDEFIKRQNLFKKPSETRDTRTLAYKLMRS